MAVSRKKSKPETEQKAQEIINHQCIVKRVKDLGEGKPIMCDIQINGVLIYGCQYKTFERKDGSGEFSIIDFPKHQDKDGKWYKWAYVKLSDDDVTKIEEQIEGLL